MGGPPGDLQGRPEQLLQRRQRAGRHQPLGQRGLGQRVRRQGPAPGLNSKVPKPVQDVYFKGLWDEQLVKGENFQFPWYQGLSVELINNAIYQKAGLTEDQFPKTDRRPPGPCARRSSTRPQTVCTIRLTVSDLLAEMVYEGGVKVYNADNTAFAFNSPEGVAWLQMYVDMVKAGTVDNTVLVTNDDRVGLNAFSAGASAVLPDRPEPRSDDQGRATPTLYGNLGMVQAPLGKSNVAGKGLMSISVKKDTKYPNASMALAQFFTNPRSMVQFSKQVAVYPSSASPTTTRSSRPPHNDRGQRSAARQGHRLDLRGHRPDGPEEGRCQPIVLTAVQSALFNNVPAQQRSTRPSPTRTSS